jgi:hypothetical protein
MGLDGVKNLYEFVQEGGTLIVEGSTSEIFPSYNLTPGVSIETPDSLFVRGSIVRGVIADTSSPIVYGYGRDQLPVYFNQGPVIRVARGGGVGGFFGGFGRRSAVNGQDVTPMATPMPLSAWNPDASAADSTRRGRGGRGGGGAGRPGAAGSGAAAAAAAGAPGGAQAARGARGAGAAAGEGESEGPRVIMEFPRSESEMLLSGTLSGGDALSGRAQVVDEPVGKGHIVMFAIRPFWRWQTQGTFMLGFNAIMNWNDLDAGKAAPVATQAGGQ